MVVEETGKANREQKVHDERSSSSREVADLGGDQTRVRQGHADFCTTEGLRLDFKIFRGRGSEVISQRFE